HGLRNFLSDIDIRRIKKDVVGNESLARAHHSCAGRRVYAAVAEVGLARGIGRYIGTNAFELAAANVLQVLTLRSGRGGFIEINRDLEALRDLSSHMACHGDAVFNGDTVNWNKGHNVGSAHARVRALMFGEIDQLGGFP